MCSAVSSEHQGFVGVYIASIGALGHQEAGGLWPRGGGKLGIKTGLSSLSGHYGRGEEDVDKESQEEEKESDLQSD